MIASKAHWSDERAVADRTHEMVIIAGDVLQPAQIDQTVLVDGGIHGKKLSKLHSGIDDGALSRDL